MFLTNKQQSGVHDGGSVKHGGHQDVVAGAIDKADVANEVVAEPVHQERVLLGRAHRGVAGRPLALGVVASVDLGVGVTQIDGDVSLELVLESDRVHAGKGLDDRRLAVSDVADGSDVDGGLTADDFRRQGRQLCDVKVR